MVAVHDSTCWFTKSNVISCNFYPVVAWKWLGIFMCSISHLDTLSFLKNKLAGAYRVCKCLPLVWFAFMNKVQSSSSCGPDNACAHIDRESPKVTTLLRFWLQLHFAELRIQARNLTIKSLELVDTFNQTVDAVSAVPQLWSPYQIVLDGLSIQTRVPANVLRRAPLWGLKVSTATFHVQGAPDLSMEAADLQIAP